ncbi:MAG: hypothetical protein JW809_16515 [Pirellulales bacterium]|nr:hypothetical protein [Pirellulales bacterium]
MRQKATRGATRAPKADRADGRPDRPAGGGQGFERKDSLSAEARGQLAALAALGPALSEADAAAVLGLPAETVAAYLATPAGGAAWRQARAQTRAELLAVLHRLAREGSPQAQKMLTDLMARDDSRPILDQRLTGAELRDGLRATKSRTQRQQHAGRFPLAGADRCYSLREVLNTIPQLWRLLDTQEAELGRLRVNANDNAMATAEAYRLLRLEMVRKRKRENDVAEGALLPRARVFDSLATLSREVRAHAETLERNLIAQLGARGETAADIRRERVAMLARIADAMETVEL